MKFHVRYILISLLTVISAGGCVQAKELSWSKYRELKDSLVRQVMVNKTTHAMFAVNMQGPGLFGPLLATSAEPQMIRRIGNIWDGKGVKELRRVTKQTCRREGVSIESFKMATEKYGVSGMPYDSVFDEYFRLMADLSTSARDEKQLEEPELERVTRLAYDLGILTPRVIVMFDPQGMLSIPGQDLSQDSVKEELKAQVLKNPHMLFQLSPDSVAPVSALFELKRLLQSFLEDVPAETLLDREGHPEGTDEKFLRTFPLFFISNKFFPQEYTEIVADTHQYRLLNDLIAEYHNNWKLSVDSSAGLSFNELHVTESKLIQILDTSGHLPFITIYSPDDFECRSLIELLRTIQYHKITRVYVVDPQLVEAD